MAGFRVSQSVEIFMSQLGLFVAVPVAFGYLSSRRKTAVASALTVLGVLCLVYYAPYADSSLSYLISLLVWTVLSLVAGPVFGVLGHAIRVAGTPGAAAVSAVVGLLAGELARMLQQAFAQDRIDLFIISLTFNALAVLAVLALLRREWLLRVVALSVPFTAFGYVIALVLR